MNPTTRRIGLVFALLIALTRCGPNDKTRALMDAGISEYVQRWNLGQDEAIYQAFDERLKRKETLGNWALKKRQMRQERGKILDVRIVKVESHSSFAFVSALASQYTVVCDLRFQSGSFRGGFVFHNSEAGLRILMDPVFISPDRQ